MALHKLKPAFKDYIWGGDRLITQCGKSCGGESLAESWELSCHPDGLCTIENGANEGRTLLDYLEEAGAAALGTNCAGKDSFPVLIKLIDAKQALSVQVHPDDDYALKHEGQPGKTEMWYIVDCEPGSFIYLGVNREVSKEEMLDAVSDNSVISLLNRIEVKPGDVFFVEAGLAHSIGEGILLAEVQQSSNLTYRLYDFGRLGADGSPRPLHINKALDVMRLEPEPLRTAPKKGLVQCRHFTVCEFVVKNSRALVAGSESFIAMLVLEGSGEMTCGTDHVSFSPYETFFISAGAGLCHITGNARFLKVSM